VAKVRRHDHAVQASGRHEDQDVSQMVSWSQIALQPDPSCHQPSSAYPISFIRGEYAVHPSHRDGDAIQDQPIVWRTRTGVELGQND
jgi:hypothetical protein